MDYSKKKTAEKHLEELKVSLAELVGADPPLPVADLIAAVKAKKLEWQLPGEEVIKVRRTEQAVRSSMFEFISCFSACIGA